MSTAKARRKAAPAELLQLFFPIHYTVGMTVEDTLRNDQLTRQQTIILWLIRSKGVDGTMMRRKDIATAMNYWFELTNSAISKALRSLARPPLDLIQIKEDPRSGREKIVVVTTKGQQFMHEMIANAERLIKILTDEMTDEEIAQGIHFFQRISDIFDVEVEQRREELGFVGKPSVSRKL